MRRKAWTVATEVAGWMKRLALEAERTMDSVEYHCWRRAQEMPKRPPAAGALTPVPQHHHHTHMAR